MLHGTATLSLAIGHLPIYILVFTVVFLVPHVAHHSCALPGSSAGAWEPVFLCLYLLGSVCLRPCLCVSVSLCVCVCLCRRRVQVPVQVRGNLCFRVCICLDLCLCVCLRLCLCLSVCLSLSEACAGSSAGAWESRAG